MTVDKIIVTGGPGPGFDSDARQLVENAIAKGVAAEGFAETAQRAAAESGVHAGDAEQAAALAQMAALTAPKVYQTKAEGLAAVGEGGTFWSDEDEPLALYRDVGGVATKLASAVTSADVVLSTQIVLFGNSIAEAPAPLTPFLTRLVTSLNAAGGRYVGLNLGRSGETAAQIRARVEAFFAAGARPKYVIFGPDTVNSWRLEADAGDVQDDLQECYNLAHNAGATVIVITDPWNSPAAAQL